MHQQAGVEFVPNGALFGRTGLQLITCSFFLLTTKKNMCARSGCKNILSSQDHKDKARFLSMNHFCCNVINIYLIKDECLESELLPCCDESSYFLIHGNIVGKPAAKAIVGYVEDRGSLHACRADDCSRAQWRLAMEKMTLPEWDSHMLDVKTKTICRKALK